MKQGRRVLPAGLASWAVAVAVHAHRRPKAWVAAALLAAPCLLLPSTATAQVPTLVPAGLEGVVTITGRVSLATGAGVPSVAVTLRRRPSQTGAPPVQAGITDMDGRFELRNVPRYFGPLSDGYVLSARTSSVPLVPLNQTITYIPETVSELAYDFTSPATLLQQHLAEGATGALFDTSLSLLNVLPDPVDVTLRFFHAGGVVAQHDLQVPPRSQRVVRVDEVPGMEAAEFATTIESNRGVLVERVMHWSDGYGSHAESAQQVANSWTFAEGSTAGFNLFYLLLNPADDPAVTTITYLRPAPAEPIQRSYLVEPKRRLTIWVNHEDPRLASTDVSAVIATPGGGLVVERAQYLETGAHPLAGGHAAAGIPLSPRGLGGVWRTYFAEGATGPWFDTFLLVANTSPSAVDADIAFTRADGASFSKAYRFAGKSRTTLWLDAEEVPEMSNHTPLADSAFLTTVTSGSPLDVERVMWWGGAAGRIEGHASRGARDSGVSWALADGVAGGPREAATYLLVGNVASTEATIRVQLYVDDGTTASRTFAVPARARFTIGVGDEFPEARGHRFGAVVDSLGEVPAEIVVERSTYENAGDVQWASGTNVTATRLR